uniref:NADH dehydrogenase [ubiquinone] 1 beta subcomplex subunit 5, mitochondrial n=1 Tax=Arion vulgaris TaxID=1028688 RepID=A0A0B6ZUV3_9EUPU
MAGMSLLRPSLRQGFRLAFTSGKPIVTPLQRKLQQSGQVSVRNSAHNQMPIVPSRFEWQRFKDDFHFYLLLGFVPMLSTVAYINIFIGPAELSDIPEGYEPKEWEYHQHPIKRWFVKYVYDEPQKEYERTLHFLRIRQESRYWAQLKKKVNLHQQDRMDYKGWYYFEVDKSIVDAEKAAKESDIYNSKIMK